MIKGARKTDPLALPSRQSDTAFAHVRVKAIGCFGFNEIEYLRRRTSLAQARTIDLVVGQAECDVTRDAVINQENVLRHVTDSSLPRRDERRCERPAIDQNLAS